MSDTTVPTVRFINIHDSIARPMPTDFDDDLVQIGDGTPTHLIDLNDDERQTVLGHMSEHSNRYIDRFDRIILPRIEGWTDEELIERVDCDPVMVPWFRVTSRFWGVYHLFLLADYCEVAIGDMFSEDHTEKDY